MKVYIVTTTDETYTEVFTTEEKAYENARAELIADINLFVTPENEDDKREYEETVIAFDFSRKRFLENENENCYYGHFYGFEITVWERELK